jgi:hypothetical protein
MTWRIWCSTLGDLKFKWNLRIFFSGGSARCDDIPFKRMLAKYSASEGSGAASVQLKTLQAANKKNARTLRIPFIL